MFRYELIGSGVGYHEASTLAEIAIRLGAKRVRQAYYMGLSNQPKTIRFSAESDEIAKNIAEKLREEVFADYRATYKTSLAPMLREYGDHWQRAY